MPIAKYEVICEGPQGQPTYWDGTDLRKKGTVVEIDTDVVKVSSTSLALKPVGDAPVFRTKVDKDGNKTYEQARK